MGKPTFEKWWKENSWRFVGEVTSQHVEIAWDAAQSAADMLLVVEGDHNDADYIVSVTPITEKKLEKFLPLIEAIKKFQPYKSHSDQKVHGWAGLPPLECTHRHNWPRGDYAYRPDLGEKSITELYSEIAEIDAEIVEEFDQEYVPHAEGNIHTINSIFVVRHDRHLFVG